MVNCSYRNCAIIERRNYSKNYVLTLRLPYKNDNFDRFGYHLREPPLITQAKKNHSVEVFGIKSWEHRSYSV